MTGCIIGWAHSKFGKLAGEDVESLIVRAAGDALADGDAVARLFVSGDKRHGFAAWTLLFYALWHQRHILCRDPGDGDTFAVLDAARGGD